MAREKRERLIVCTPDGDGLIVKLNGRNIDEVMEEIREATSPRAWVETSSRFRSGPDTIFVRATAIATLHKETF